MPESFILALILFGIAAVILLAAPFVARRKVNVPEPTVEEDRYGYKRKVTKNSQVPIGWKAPLLLFVILVAIGAAFTVNASFNQVPVRNIGIVTEFKKPIADNPSTKDNESVTGAGVSWVKPWQKVEEWDANYELWDHRSANDGKGLKVKIAGNQDAYVPVSVEYAPNPDRAANDFVDYARDRNNWISRRVDPTLLNSVSTLFRTHDPLAKANVDPVTGQVNPPDMTPYINELNSKLKGSAASNDMLIRNLYLGTIVYNDKTNEQLAAYATKVLENRNLIQEEKNQILRNNITNKQAQVDERTYCLQIADKHGRDPGLCFLSGDTPVIVGNSPQK